MSTRVYRGFTLAEVAIVLMVLGILTAVLLPTAIKNMPDENVLKFRKGNSTLYTVIKTLVENEQYYLSGDLGIKPNGDLIEGSSDEDKKYFCETFAQIVSYKSKNCSISGANGHQGGLDLRGGYGGYGYTYEEGAVKIDSACNECQSIGAEIVTIDDITYFQTTPSFAFGYIFPSTGKRNFGASPTEAAHTDATGFGALYKIFCMDVDGINKGEAPFGYGIRADGKIFQGARAQEWMEKKITREN